MSKMMRELKTDAERAAWSRRYETAMSRFLRRKKSASLLSALRLGRQAAPLGLEPLDVARVHEQALNTVLSPDDTPGNAGREQLERADTFFRETIVPIEATHRAAREADSRIDRLTRTLRQRAAESSASDAQLTQAVAQREAAEASVETRAAHHDNLLKEAHRVQTRLRDQMRAILSHQEGECEGIGRELRDEIIQALVGIDLCLLALKTSGRVNTDKTEKSIADAQRILVTLRERGFIAGEARVDS